MKTCSVTAHSRANASVKHSKTDRQLEKEIEKLKKEVKDAGRGKQYSHRICPHVHRIEH
jgi:hypothetical protein